MSRSKLLKVRFGMAIAFVLMSSHVGAQSPGRISVLPAKETPGMLGHGVTLDTTHDAVPILISLEGIEQPFVGSARFQYPGRAVISVVSFAGVKVSGYVVSPIDKKQGLPMRCVRQQELSKSKECIVGEINAGERVSVVFPDGLDIMTRH